MGGRKENKDTNRSATGVGAGLFLFLGELGVRNPAKGGARASEWLEVDGSNKEDESDDDVIVAEADVDEEDGKRSLAGLSVESGFSISSSSSWSKSESWRPLFKDFVLVARFNLCLN